MSNFRSNFHVELAQLFYYDLLYRRSSYYYFLGKVDKWDAVDLAPPPLPIDSQQQDDIIRSNMVFAKRISPSDVSLACKHYPWTNGVVYDQWDNTQVMYDKEFFVLTDDYRVYKCLDNSNNSQSLIQPTGNSIAPVRLEDGYLWKYMYSIPPFRRSRFITVNNIPVQKALSDNFFNRGELEGAAVVSGGSGYTNTSATTITVTDSGKTVGSGATGTVTLGSAINNIQSVTVTAPGSGYTRGVAIDINSVSGSGAVLFPVIKYTTTFNTVTNLSVNDILVSEGKEYKVTNISGLTVQFKNEYTTLEEFGIPTINQVFAKKDTIYTFTSGAITAGIVDSVFVADSGIGYSVGTTVTFRVGGAQIIPKINNAGTLVGTIILEPGIGYNLPPTLALDGGGIGTGKYGTNTTAIINAIIDDGQVQMVSIVDPGVGYPYETNTLITVQGDGSGAQLTPVVYNGEIIDVILENPGTGYTFTVITVSDTAPGSPGNGAVIRSIIDTSDYESDQSIIEQTATPGAIYSIGIADGGNGYSANTTITIEGDGTGATAQCTVIAGVITRTIVTNFGSGYSYANVIINDPGITPGAGAELYAIMPPPGGHGSDAPAELFGDTVVLNSSLRNEVIATDLDQDFRQFGILKNPRDQFSFANYVNETALILYKASFNNVTGLLKDEILVQGNNRFIVAEIDGTTVYLAKQNLAGSLQTGAANKLISVAEPTREYICSAVLTSPNFNKYSGSLLYISNEGSFTFSPEQGIIIKTLIRF